MLNSITFENFTIKKVVSKSYLGVTLDENLNWKVHIKELEKSLIKLSNSFKIIKHKIPDENKLLLYYAYVYSKIQYGLEVFGSASATEMRKIQTKQNTALKILFSKDFYTPTIQLHHDLSVLLVKDIYKLYLTKFVYKHQNGLLPEAFDDYFIKNDTFHTHFTRQNMNLHKSQYKNQTGQKMIKHKGITFWNEFPSNVRNAVSINVFTRKAKEYLLSNY